MHDFDIAVVGGGIVGLSVGLLLSKKKQNYNIAIIDENFASVDYKVSAINEASIGFFKELDLWHKVTKKNLFTKMVIYDHYAEDAKLNFTCNNDENYLGYVVNNNDIKQVLLDSVKTKKNITLITDKLQQFDNLLDISELTLINSTIKTKLTIAADGKNSKIHRLSDISAQSFDYNQTALVANIRTEKSTLQCAWQKYIGKEVIGLLPLSDNLFSIVWSCEPSYALELLSLGKDKFCQVLNSHFSYFGQLYLYGEIYNYPLKERLSDNYIEKNLVLVGDAAHTTHPMVGQGLNLGLADCKEIVQQITNYPYLKLGDIRVLKKYQYIRRSEVYIMAKFIRGVQCGFSQNNSLISNIREHAMNFISQNNYINSFLKLRASGRSC